MDYEITTYRNADPITHVEQFANGTKQAKRGGKEVCLADEPAGDRWWRLSHGHLDVGPYAYEELALVDALETAARFGAVSVAYKGERLPANAIEVFADLPTTSDILKRIDSAIKDIDSDCYAVSLLALALVKRALKLERKGTARQGTAPSTRSLIATFGVQGHSNDEGRHRGLSRFRMESRQGRIR